LIGFLLTSPVVMKLWMRLAYSSMPPANKDDVMNIFKNNRNIFDKLKLEDEPSHKALMDKFSAAKKTFEEGAQ